MAGLGLFIELEPLMKTVATKRRRIRWLDVTAFGCPKYKSAVCALVCRACESMALLVPNRTKDKYCSVYCGYNKRMRGTKK